MRLLWLAALATATALAPLGAHAAPAPAPKVAVFNLEFIDSTGNDPSPADLANTARLSDQMRQVLEKSGQFDVVSIAPVKADIAKAPEIHDCNGCEIDFAKKLGAQYAMVGLVRRASEHLFSISLVLENATTGKPVKTGNATVRGDDEASWYRGVKFVLDDQFLE